MPRLNPAVNRAETEQVHADIQNWRESVLTVAQPELGNEGLLRDAHQVIIARPIDHIAYPTICPCCGAPATTALSIAKPFMFSPGGDSGWGHRVAQAHPLFCNDCLARHRALVVPVTDLDRLASLWSQELLIPAFGLGLFGGFIFLGGALAFLRNPSGEWPRIAFAGLMILIGLHCARSAWRAGAYRRVATQTPVSACFDFGDDDNSAFQKTARTYAIRNRDYAIAFDRLNNSL
jgi:hypothetical protein